MTGIPSPPNTPGLSLHLAHLNSTQSMERLRRTRKWNPNMIKAQPPPQPPEGPTDRQCSQRPHGPVQTTTASTDAPMKVHTAGRSHKTPVSKSLQGGPHSRTTQTSFWWSGPAPILESQNGHLVHSAKCVFHFSRLVTACGARLMRLSPKSPQEKRGGAPGWPSAFG